MSTKLCPAVSELFLKSKRVQIYETVEELRGKSLTVVVEFPNIAGVLGKLLTFIPRPKILVSFLTQT